MQSSKIFWGEGQFLSPQHFQYQDAYHEAQLLATRQAIAPFGWGLRSLQADQQSLASGSLRLTRLTAIFPDGTLYSAPDKDALPMAQPLDHISESATGTLIYLALPLLQEHRSNCNADGASVNNVRYSPNSQSTQDLFSDAVEANLVYLDKNVRLLTEDQPRDAYTVVPLMRVRRNSTGGFEQDDSFLPPAVHITTNNTLMSRLRSLLDALQARANALYSLFRKPNESLVEFRSGDMASFWLLHSVNTAFASLVHFYQHPELSPERLHLELARIAGSLLTFSTEYGLEDLPSYSHTNPAEGFNRLFSIIESQISTVFSASYFSIPLQEDRPSFHSGHFSIQEIGTNARFFLAAKAEVPAAQLVDLVPKRFKISSPTDVQNIVLSALPGIRLEHEPQVPSAVPVKPGFSYFSLQAKGSLYEHMIDAEAITVYIPKGILGLEVELLAVAS